METKGPRRDRTTAAEPPGVSQLPPALQARLEALQARAQNNPHDASVRQIAAARARDACEYCLLPTLGEFHIEQIIPRVRWDLYVRGEVPGLPPLDGRRGPDHLDNFAWACPFCNEAKGQQVTRRVGGRVTRLFDPRHDHWDEHFAFTDLFLFIAGGPGIGDATVRALRFNDARPRARLSARHKQIMSGAYPPSWARAWAVRA